VNEKENWAMTAEFVLGFDLTEGQLGEIAAALDAPCSWDGATHRFSTTISVRNAPVDAVLAKGVRRISEAVLGEAHFAKAAMTPVAFEAMTFAEQDRRLRRIS